MKLLALFMALFCLALVLGACQTEPATNVTSTGATLNARGSCNTSYHLYWWYELRRFNSLDSTVTSWNPVGPSHRVDCTSNTAEQAIDSQNIGNLFQNTDYQFRVAYQQDGQGQSVCAADGACTPKGSSAEPTLNYDGLTTEGESSVGGEIGQEYATGSALPSVSAQQCIVWGHTWKFGHGGSGSRSWTRGILNNICPRQMKLQCDVFIEVDGAGKNSIDTGTYPDSTCNAFAANEKYNPCPERYAPREACASSVFEFTATLLANGRSWSSGYYKGDRPNEGCSTFYNDVGQDVLECQDARGLAH